MQIPQSLRLTLVIALLAFAPVSDAAEKQKQATSAAAVAQELLLNPNVYDEEFYRAQAGLPADASPAAVAQDYLTRGLSGNIQAHPYFRVGDYLAAYPEVEAATGGNPEQAVNDYLTQGLGLGRRGVEALPSAVIGAATLGPAMTLYSRGRCYKFDVPDMAARAFIDALGKVQILSGGVNMYRIEGDTLDAATERECGAPVFTSELDPEYEVHRSREWLEATYTRDGKKVVAIAATDCHFGFKSDSDCSSTPSSAKEKKSPDWFWWGVDTLLVSNDGGRAFDTPSDDPQSYVLAAPPGNPSLGAGGKRIGYFQTSNIMKNPEDGHYYVYIWAQGSASEDAPDKQKSGMCLLQATDGDALEKPASWRGWDGSGFTVDTASGAPCTTLRFPHNIDVRSVTYNTFFESFIAVGIDPTTGAPGFALSKSLTDWRHSGAYAILPKPAGARLVYATIIDPAYAYLAAPQPDAAERRNFDITGPQPYLYFTSIPQDRMCALSTRADPVQHRRGELI